MRGRLADEPEGLPAGAGPVWAGGFAFAPDGGSRRPLVVVPAGPAGAARALPAANRRPDLADRERRLAGAPIASRSCARLARRLASIREQPLPMFDPSPRGRDRDRERHPARRLRGGGRRRRSSESAPASSRRSCSRARSRSRRRRRTIPARRLRRPARPVPVLLLLLRRLARGRLPRRQPRAPAPPPRRRVATVALAGSIRRSADPAVDDHLGEQLLHSAKDRGEHEIVARRIERKLAPRSVWVEADADPRLIKVANIQHLATPVHAQLADPLSAVELAGTAAPDAGGRRRADASARAAIAELEDLDRGWYAGPVGWMDSTEDGEFCVALRSALLRDRTAHLFAGAGIVADSDPAAELAETELKLEALLPLLSYRARRAATRPAGCGPFGAPDALIGRVPEFRRRSRARLRRVGERG